MYARVEAAHTAAKYNYFCSEPLSRVMRVLAWKLEFLPELLKGPTAAAYREDRHLLSAEPVRKRGRVCWDLRAAF